MHQNLFPLVGSHEIGFGKCRHQRLPLPGGIYFSMFYFKSYLQRQPPGSKWHHCHSRVMSQMRNGRVQKWRIIQHTEKWAWEQGRLFEPWLSHFWTQFHFVNCYLGGNSLAVHWLGLHVLTAKDPGSNPGQGTNIPQALWCCQKKNKKMLSGNSNNRITPCRVDFSKGLAKKTVEACVLAVRTGPGWLRHLLPARPWTTPEPTSSPPRFPQL